VDLGFDIVACFVGLVGRRSIQSKGHKLLLFLFALFLFWYLGGLAAGRSQINGNDPQHLSPQGHQVATILVSCHLIWLREPAHTHQHRARHLCRQLPPVLVQGNHRNFSRHQSWHRFLNCFHWIRFTTWPSPWQSLYQTPSFYLLKYFLGSPIFNRSYFLTYPHLSFLNPISCYYHQGHSKLTHLVAFFRHPLLICPSSTSPSRPPYIELTEPFLF